MPLEQWEIELRNQLAGVPESEDPEPQPTEETPEAAEPSAETTTGTEARAESSGSTATFIVTLVFLLGVTLFVYDDKTGGSLRKQAASWFKRSEAKTDEPKEKEKPKAEASSDVAREIEKLRNEQNQKIEALTQKLNTTNDKVKAVGLLLNENFNILGQKIKDSFIFLNRDWTLDRAPKYLELHPDDLEYLKRYVRENQ